MEQGNEPPVRRPSGVEPMQAKPHSIARLAAAALTAAALAGGLSAPAVAHPHIWVSVETTVLVEAGTVVGFRHRWTFDEFYTAMAIQGLDKNNDGVYSREELAELAQVNIDGLKDFSYFTFVRLGDRTLELLPPKDYWLTHGPPPADSKPGASPPNAVAAVAQATTEPRPEPGVVARVWSRLFGSSTPRPDAAAPATPPATPPAASAAKVLALEFTVPLKQPVLVEAPAFTVSVYDPSWYIAFELAAGEPVKLAGAPSGCKIDLGDARRASDADAARIGDAFSGQFGGPATVKLSGTRQISIDCGAKP